MELRPDFNFDADGIGQAIHRESINHQEGFTSSSHISSEAPEQQTHNDAVLKLLESVRIDPSEPLVPPPVCLEMVGGDFTATVATLGNFSLTIGKAKSRKTFSVSIAVAAATCNGTMLGVIRGNFPPDKRKVLYFDTEQGKYHVQKCIKRICELSGNLQPDNLLVYSLRKFKPAERMEMIGAAIYNTDGVGLVVIDGVRDLLTSINDEDQATAMASNLLRWTEEREIHILCVLHQNKGDNNARGHIGTELVNKAETVLSVQKSEEDKDISIVQAEYCRDREPEPFAFEVDEYGMPRIAENWQIRTNKKPNSIGIDEIEDWRLYQLMTDSFAGADKLSYSDLVRRVKLSFKSQFGKSIGDNKTKDIVVYAKTHDWVYQEKEKAPYKLGRFNSDTSDSAIVTV
ncbi:AAA family ATPase [Telluribacter sp. SYSU D00476]|uniref:AAA family ATPase n=1 Tax=Telluribacter sp. SYSU D00476 TaxID=2811430 RepID=UPI001FF22AE5|nr:AAA family ATPase [Telluribacter sp. SYSU D00476]